MTKAETHLAELLKKVSNHSDGSTGSSSSQDASQNDKEKLFLALAKMLTKSNDALDGQELNQNKSPDTRNNKILSDVMDSFQQEIAVSVRHEMSKQLAAEKNPPIDLALKLATDQDLSVARPILEIVNFSDAELIHIIERTTHDHHMIIAKRGDLTKPVWKALTRQRMQAERHRFQKNSPKNETQTAKSADIEKIAHHRPLHHLKANEISEERDTSNHIMEKLDNDSPSIPSFLLADAPLDPVFEGKTSSPHYHQGKTVFPPPNDVPLMDNDGTDDLVEGILHQTPDHGSEEFDAQYSMPLNPNTQARFGSKYQALKNRNPLQTDDSQREFDAIKRIAAQMALKTSSDPLPNHDDINWQEEENARQSAVAEKALHHINDIIQRDDHDDIDDVDLLAQMAGHPLAKSYDFDDSLSDAIDDYPSDISHQMEKTHQPRKNHSSFDDTLVGDGSWQFRTDREGHLDALDQAGAHYFGGDADNLKETSFFQKLASKEAEALDQTISHHQPIRDMVVQIEAPDGSPQPWKLRAKARFNPLDGKFIGYEGTAMPVDPLEAESVFSDAARHHQTNAYTPERPSERPSRATSKALLQKLFLKHLSGTTADATQHLTELATNLLEEAQQSQNRSIMQHALEILEQSRTIHHQLENVGVLESTIASDLAQKRGRKYSIKRVMEEVLDEDAIIEGEAARYYIDPSANALETNFDSALLRKIISRMVLVARKFGSRESDRLIKITSSISGHLIIRIPLGTVEQLTWSINDVLFDPVAAMKDGLKRHDSNNLSRMAAFSLSAMKPAAQKAGADIKIIRTSGNMRELILDIQS